MFTDRSFSSRLASGLLSFVALSGALVVASPIALVFAAFFIS